MTIIYVFLIFILSIFILNQYFFLGFNNYVYNYLKQRFELNKKSNKTINLIISIINSLIIGGIGTLAIICNYPIYIILPISFVYFILTIYFIYGLLGKYLRRKENEKAKK